MSSNRGEKRGKFKYFKLKMINFYKSKYKNKSLGFAFQGSTVICENFVMVRKQDVKKMNIALQWNINPEYLYWPPKIWYVLSKRNSISVFCLDFNEKRGNICKNARNF